MKQTRLVPFDIEKAKQGAKVVTKNGLDVKITYIEEEREYKYPIEAIVRNPTGETTSKDTLYYTKEGRLLSSGECDLDLLIEEEETDYDPYKATVESIADMVERYDGADSDLRDFYNQVKVRCKEAVEYDNTLCEKQVEKKPDDNDAPKFKVGDWVVTKDGNVNQVKTVSDDGYSYTLDDETYFSGSWKDTYHLWSVQDAKDGDVLVINDVVFIYAHKKLLIDIAVAHCCVDSTGVFHFDGEFGYDEFGGTMLPATKEQRDFLFQKMKEAGYEWDSDKNELKKIKEVKTRRMTNQELSWWLRDHPEEHREICRYAYENVVFSRFHYAIEDANKEVEDDDIRIRKNGGEWQEPLIEE